MNSTLKFRYARLTALCATLGFASLASAQTSVTTVPVGAMTYSFPATTTSQVTTTYISIPLTNPSVFTGPVASLTANTITFAGTPFTATSLAAVGSPFFARIATGVQAGRTILVKANTTNSITVDTTDNSSQTTDLTTSGWTVAAGDRIEIIVGDTLASLMGDNTASNPLFLTGGSILGLADSISIYNKSLARFDTYFFSTTSGYWRSSSVNTSVNSMTIYPEAAISLTRRGGRSATSLIVTGEVPVVPPLTKTPGNSVVYVSTRYPVDMKLINLASSGWTKGAVLGTSDTISLYSSSTSFFDSFFQLSSNSQWRKSGAGAIDQGNLVSIPAGSMVAIFKRNSLSGQASFYSLPLPYTL